MTFRFCCCGCTSGYRVFVPCDETEGTVDYIAPVLTEAQFNDMGFSEGVVYLYDAIQCEDFCGSWKCISDADQEENRCHPDVGSGCPSCEAWDGTLEAPYRVIRFSEEATFPARFTIMNDDCCDDQCPTDCSNVGQVIPADCATCYDPALLQWGASVSFTQTQQAQCDVYDGNSFVTDPDTGQSVECPSLGGPRTVDCDVSIYGVTPTIVGNDLELCVVLQVLMTKNMTADCQGWTGTETIPWLCHPGCIDGDPDPTDVPGTQWVTYHAIKIDIPCMATASYTFGNCTTPDGDEMCGLFPMGSPSLQSAFQVTSEISPIGWGGNIDVVRIIDREVTWSANPGGLCAGCTGNLVQGQGTYTLEISASLPERPEGC